MKIWIRSGTSTACSKPTPGRAMRLTLLASTCAAALIGTAYAQDPQQAQNDGRSAPATELGAVMVRAETAEVGTKTDTKLTEIPQSISVVAADLFTDRAAVDFQDVFRYSAGISAAPSGVDVRGDAFTARGFATVQYLDGLNRQPDYIYGARMEVFTMERVEILRGPSSVLYGAGGSGGLVNAVSKTPRHEFGGEVELVVGDPLRKQLNLDITGGLSDTVAGRVVAVVRDGELQWDGQPDDRKVLMPSLSWSPGENTNVTLIGLYQEDNLGTQTYLPFTASAGAAVPEDRLPYDFFTGDKGFNHSDIEHRSISIMVDHSFSDAVKFTSRTRRYSQDVDYAETYATRNSPPGPLLPREFYVLKENYKGLNSDNNVAFNFTTGSFEHKVLAGADYTLFKQERQEGFSCAGLEGLYGCFAGGSPPPLSVINPDYYMHFDTGFTNAFGTRSTQLGVYVQDQVKYKDNLTLVVGVRRDRATSEASGVKEPVNNATTYRIGLIGEIGGGVSPYVSYSESFLPVFGGDYFGNAFKPREGRQYEVGVKWQVNPTSLVTVSAFDIEESNYVVQDPNFLQNFIQTGKVGSKGYEVEANLNLAGVDVNASWSYTDAKILSATDGTQGNRVANLPRYLASLWFSKSAWLTDDVRIRFGAGARYTGSKIDTTQRFLTKQVTVADAMVGLEYERWRFALNASNIFNKKYYSTCATYSPTSGSCYTSSPRMVLASVRYAF